MQTDDNRGMLRTAQPLLHDGQYCRQRTPYQRHRIEPQTWKDFAPQPSIGIYGQLFVLPGTQHKPIDGLL